MSCVSTEFGRVGAQVREKDALITRRHALRVGGSLATGALLGALAADNGSLQISSSNESPGVSDEYDPSFDGVNVKLGVVILAAEGLDRYDGSALISQIVFAETERITHATNGAFTFDPTFHNCSISPDSKRRTDEGKIEPYYSDGQLKEIYEEYANVYRHLGKVSIITLVVDCASTETVDYGGLASRYDLPPFAIIVPSRSCYRVYSHEIGHLLNPRAAEWGRGMDHESMMTSRLEEDGEVKQLYSLDTIQQLIADGCGLTENADGEVNGYASFRSVMGSMALQNINDKLMLDPPGVPIYSPPEIAFLDPRRNVRKVAPTPDKYPLSYDPDGLFGVEITLPVDHVLKKILPEANTLFFGLMVTSVDDEADFESDQTNRIVSVFATSNGGRATTLLNISLFNRIYRDGRENVIYADEQLGFVAVSGYADDSEYVRFIDLNTPEGRRVLEEARRRTAERNEILMQPN